MRLSELKKLVTLLEENAGGVDINIRFSDYSRRHYPVLDTDRAVEKIEYSQHIGCYVPDEVTFYLPLDTPADAPPEE